MDDLPLCLRTLWKNALERRAYRKTKWHALWVVGTLVVKNVAYKSSFYSKKFMECKYVVHCTYVLPSCQTVAMDVRKQDPNLNAMCTRAALFWAPLLSATPKIRSEVGVPLLFIKRSDVGVALIFLRRAKIWAALFFHSFFSEIFFFSDILFQ